MCNINVLKRKGFSLDVARLDIIAERGFDYQMYSANMTK